MPRDRAVSGLIFADFRLFGGWMGGWQNRGTRMYPLLAHKQANLGTVKFLNPQTATQRNTLKHIT